MLLLELETIVLRYCQTLQLRVQHTSDNTSKRVTLSVQPHGAATLRCFDYSRVITFSARDVHIQREMHKVRQKSRYRIIPRAKVGPRSVPRVRFLRREK